LAPSFPAEELSGKDITIDPSRIIPEPDKTTVTNPVASAIANFFGLDYQEIAG
jgi:hypothetical protein